MKRLFANPWRRPGAHRSAFAILCLSLALAACGSDDRSAVRPADVENTGWMVPPRFEAAEFAGGAVVVSGRAEPNRRVVLTDQDGLAAAASADAQGAFSVRLVASPGVSLWRIEMAVGADEARTGQWLAVWPSARAAAVLRAGAAARPVGPAGLLATADYDGGGLLVAGLSAPGQTVQVAVDDGPVQTVRADGQGWYAARFPGVGPGPHRLRARTPEMTREVVVTLAAPSGALDFTEAPSGLRIDWPIPGGGGQSTWLLDRAASVGPAEAP